VALKEVLEAALLLIAGEKAAAEERMAARTVAWNCMMG
jgi:hypothetical protein